MPTPAVDDFEVIRANLERIRKEQEEAEKNKSETPEPQQRDDYHGCG